MLKLRSTVVNPTLKARDGDVGDVAMTTAEGQGAVKILVKRAKTALHKTVEFLNTYIPVY